MVPSEVDMVKLGRVRLCEPQQGTWCSPEGEGKFTEGSNQRSQRHDLTSIQQEDFLGGS